MHNTKCITASIASTMPLRRLSMGNSLTSRQQCQRRAMHLWLQLVHKASNPCTSTPRSPWQTRMSISRPSSARPRPQQRHWPRRRRRSGRGRLCCRRKHSSRHQLPVPLRPLLARGTTRRVSRDSLKERSIYARAMQTGSSCPASCGLR